jgi:hypothetical protein
MNWNWFLRRPLLFLLAARGRLATKSAAILGALTMRPLATPGCTAIPWKTTVASSAPNVSFWTSPAVVPSIV